MCPIGTGVGENRASAAARMAISSPLLEVSVEGAKGVLFNITGGNDLTMNEVDEAAKMIAAAVDPEANIIFGATIDEQMVDQIKITVIATGFDEAKRRIKELTSNVQTMNRQVETISQGNRMPVSAHASSQSQAQSKDEEMDKWDIPTFLRQGRN
jgi:cell division protein FtsZ